MTNSITSAILPAVVAATDVNPAKMPPANNPSEDISSNTNPPPIGDRVSVVSSGDGEAVSGNNNNEKGSPVTSEEGVVKIYMKSASKKWEQLKCLGKKVAVVALLVFVAIVLAATGNYAFAAIVLTVAIFTGLALQRMHRHPPMTAIPLPQHDGPNPNPQGLPLATPPATLVL